MKKFGRMISDARRSAGLSLAQLSTAVRVSTSYLCRIENGDRTRKPSAGLMLRLAHRLGLNPDEVFAASGRIPADIAQWITGTPGVLPRLRREMGRAA